MSGRSRGGRRGGGGSGVWELEPVASAARLGGDRDGGGDGDAGAFCAVLGRAAAASRGRIFWATGRGADPPDGWRGSRRRRGDPTGVGAANVHVVAPERVRG
jgi:hypothetical protein